MSTQTLTVADLVLRKPSKEDGSVLYELVRESEALEENTTYAYLLLTSHFRDTCIVAELDGEIVGFVAAYLIPTRPDTVFVWQVGVSRKARRMGLARRMLEALLDRQACGGVRYLEATVEPKNHASHGLFQALADARDAALRRTTGFESTDFGAQDHAAEVLVRVGPMESK